ncbi:hypothetical protein ACLKA6_006896 [Drosophila palustris]
MLNGCRAREIAQVKLTQSGFIFMPLPLDQVDGVARYKMPHTDRRSRSWPFMAAKIINAAQVHLKCGGHPKFPAGRRAP